MPTLLVSIVEFLSSVLVTAVSLEMDLTAQVCLFNYAQEQLPEIPHV